MEFLWKLYEEEQKILRKNKKKPWAWRKWILDSGVKRVYYTIYQLRNNLPYRQLQRIFGFNSPSTAYDRFMEWIKILEKILKKLWRISEWGDIKEYIKKKE